MKRKLHAVLYGMATLLNLPGLPIPPSHSSEMSDAEILREDGLAIGRDFRQALDEYGTNCYERR